MGFNNGFEHVRLENKWKKLRIQYREAGMSEEAIQEMYNFDVQVVNSEQRLSIKHISEPTRRSELSRNPTSA